MISLINLLIIRPVCLYSSFFLRLLTDPSINKSPRRSSPVANLSVSVAPLHGPATSVGWTTFFDFPRGWLMGRGWADRISRRDRGKNNPPRVSAGSGFSSSQSSSRCKCCVRGQFSVCLLTLPWLSVLLPMTARVRRHLLTDTGRLRCSFGVCSCCCLTSLRPQNIKVLFWLPRKIAGYSRLMLLNTDCAEIFAERPFLLQPPFCFFSSLGLLCLVSLSTSLDPN